MSTQIKIIIKDLNTITANGRVKSLSGRDKGEALRANWELGELEKQNNTIIFIKIPEGMYNLAPSFIQGLFSETVYNIGKEGFVSKYQFSPKQLIVNQIHLVIEKLHRDKTRGEKTDA